MELLLTGTSGPLMRFTDTLITEVVRSVGHATPILHRHDPAVENTAITDAVREGKLTAVMLIGDPLSCLCALVDAGHTPLEAARVLTAATAPLALWAGWSVVRLRPDTIVAEAVDTILGSMGLTDGVLPSLSATGWRTSSLADVAASLTEPLPDRSVSAAERALAAEVVAPLFATAATGVPLAVTWSRDCLFWGDHPGEKLPRIIDLTGPARVLAYGPYLHLPPGSWMVRATLAFSPAAIGAPFAIELHGDGLLGRGRFKPGAAGVFAASFPARVRSPHLANEIRVVSEAGAIDGEIGVDHFQLIPGAP
jgi:hypothetical protein